MQYSAHQRTSPRHSSPWFTESIQGAVKVHYSLKNPTPVGACLEANLHQSQTLTHPSSSRRPAGQALVSAISVLRLAPAEMTFWPRKNQSVPVSASPRDRVAGGYS